MFELTGKVAIVTGGGGGLGRPLAVGLAKAGADVVVTSRDKTHLEPVVKDIEAAGRKALSRLLRRHQRRIVQGYGWISG